MESIPITENIPGGRVIDEKDPRMIAHEKILRENAHPKMERVAKRKAKGAARVKHTVLF